MKGLKIVFYQMVIFCFLSGCVPLSIQEETYYKKKAEEYIEKTYPLEEYKINKFKSYSGYLGGYINIMALVEFEKHPNIPLAIAMPNPDDDGEFFWREMTAIRAKDKNSLDGYNLEDKPFMLALWEDEIFNKVEPIISNAFRDTLMIDINIFYLKDKKRMYGIKLDELGLSKTLNLEELRKQYPDIYENIKIDIEISAKKEIRKFKDKTDKSTLSLVNISSLPEINSLYFKNKTEEHYYSKNDLINFSN